MRTTGTALGSTRRGFLGRARINGHIGNGRGGGLTAFQIVEEFIQLKPVNFLERHKLQVNLNSL